MQNTTREKQRFMPTSLLSKWDMFSPENLKYFCGSDLEEFLCCAALSGKKTKSVTVKFTVSRPIK